MTHEFYESPLSGRYPSEEMKRIWSDDMKFQQWRRLWITLAHAQQQLGLSISDDQIREMEQNITNINYARAMQLESELKHDVMAHIRAFGEVAPGAAGIIHWGATSCDITDNAELIQIKDSLQLICVRLARAIAPLRDFAWEHHALPTLGFTHLQPAQLVTVGKRAAMWLQDLVLDLQALEALRDNLKFRGIKGATGTQDSFLKLFNGDHTKVAELNQLVTKASGFTRCFTITGQTYTRKQDTCIVQILASFGATAHKIGTDIRILQHRKEIEEPFDEKQVGSTAMAYKRNPMRSERMCGLGRQLINQAADALHTHATQALERSLDDSAARRFYLPESFLLADAICLLLHNVFSGLIVYPAIITRHLNAELPFMATEKILMAMVSKGASRQDCHEHIRQHAQAAGDLVKHEGADNDLMDRLRRDNYFAPVHDQLEELLDPSRFIGRAARQVEEFMPEVNALLEPYRDQLGGETKLSV